MKNLIILVIAIAVIITIFLSYGTAHSTKKMCKELGGRVESTAGEYPTELCHFDDGSFCAFEVIEAGNCIPGEYEFPGPRGGDAL